MTDDSSTGGSDRSRMWEVVLECVAEDGSKYLYEDHIPLGPKAETPMEAVHWAIKHTAYSDETPCGIGEIRKVPRDNADTGVDDR